MVTLRDIAEDVGVTIAVVSKVLNKCRGSIGASAETAAKIREAAERLGYRRNRTAASLRTGRQNTIGVMLHPWGASGSGLTEALLRGIATEAGRLDQQLELAFYETAEAFDRALDRMTASAVDGLIVAGVRHADLTEHLIRQRDGGMPVVTVHTDSDPASVPNVSCDQVAIGRLAAEHLIDQGCRRIAFIRRGDLRYQGYREALDAAGIAFDEELIHGNGIDREITFSDGMAAAKHFLRNTIPFDGMVGSCDLYAMGALRVLDRAGVRVPEDVKLIGVDDSPACEYGVVSLSSISQVAPERAAKAVQMVMAAQAGESIKSILMPPILQPRQSSGVESI